MKVLILGSKGMLGHIVQLYLTEKKHTVFCTSRDKENEYYYDVLENINGIEKILEKTKPDFVINCIGILNQFAEQSHSSAVIINSLLPHYLDELSKKYNYKFIHISTDCVFSGSKGKYNENDTTDAESFYGRSKALGEVINDQNITFRTSIIGPDINSKGIGLFKWFMEQEGSVKGYSKVIWSGVTTLQLAKVIEQSFSTNITGLYHVVNNQVISKYELLKLFKKYYNKEIEIEEYQDYKSDKSLINNREDYIFEIPTYEKMIEEMKEWTDLHKELYKL